MAKILILNGPNLNMLGSREPHLYGQDSLKKIIESLNQEAKALNHSLKHFQSNAEHELIHELQQTTQNKIEFIIINPAAFTHTSIALYDALLLSGLPYIEVHLTNIYARESFRRHSYFSHKAYGTLTGFGAQSYSLALQAAHQFLLKAKQPEY